MRIGMIHQPHFLPWPGYFARCLAANVFIVLDNVKYKRNHYHQRTKYVGIDGATRWLSLPIANSTSDKNICDVRIADSFRLREWQRPFVHHYMHVSNFRSLWAGVSSRISEGYPSLLAVNVGTLTQVLHMLAAASSGLAPEIVMASSSRPAVNRTGRLRDLCEAAGITHLIMGRDALLSHDCVNLRRAGIELVRHVYRGDPDRAPQAGVSVLHEILNRGADGVATWLQRDWSIEVIDDLL
jgi:hypothetical protein